jgi:16S rRNA processing protein RimM
MAETGRTRWLSAGRVGRPHGLDGSFHVLEPSAPLLAPGAVVQVNGRDVRIERRAGDDRRPIVRLEGLGGRGDAEALRGEHLLVERTQAPQLEADEWWAEDLEECEVFDGERRVGVVRRLLTLPSCDVLEVDRDAARELLVPLVGDAVREVDVQRRRIDVDLRFLGEE